MAPAGAQLCGRCADLDRFCPLSLALEVVGDHWSLLVVRALMAGLHEQDELCGFLSSADQPTIDETFDRLIEAGVIVRVDAPGREAEPAYHLTERGADLIPVVESLTWWGLASMLLLAPGGTDHQEFDQSWAIADPASVTDETYEWTVDGVTLTLEVRGLHIVRSRGRAVSPAAIMSLSSDALDSLAFGRRTLSAAVASGEVTLSGDTYAVKRMFAVVGFPSEILDL